MALTAVRVWPLGPEQAPGSDGMAREVWRLTGDGSDVDITLTPDTLKKGIYFVTSGGATHNLSASAGVPSTTVTLTFATAPGNGLLMDVVLHGKL